MRCPVIGTASTPAPSRVSLLAADQVGTFVRRWALLLAAVGAGVVVAVLLQEPAAADGRDDGSGGGRHQQGGVLVERVVRLGLSEAPERRHQQVTTIDDGRPGAPSRASEVVSPGGIRPPAAAPGLDARSSRATPLPQVALDVARGAAQRGERLPDPRSDTTADTRQRRAALPGRVPMGVDSVRPPRPGVLPVDPMRPARPVVLPVVSSTAGLVADRSLHAVRGVLHPTIGPVVSVLDRVVDAALGEVIVVPSPRLPTPTAPEGASAGVSDALSPAPPAAPAAWASPARTTVVAVRGAVPPPTPSAPVALVLAVASVSGAASVGRGVGWSGPVPAGAGSPVRPVAPTDHDAAGASDRSAPGSGAGSPVVRPSPSCSAQVFDVLPLVVGAGYSAVSARPG